ncbi:MAG: L-histidine N(alpha)-methyltransferase [Myxococcales bacterium]|nr:L-histidine N(alpha)-methyltransferase [Myxococcales bacterium]
MNNKKAFSTKSALSILVHESQFPEVTQRQVVNALANHHLPARILYDSPAQAARWLQYHRSWAPHYFEGDLLKLYNSAFDHALDAIHRQATQDIHYISLGCGGGGKDAIFLDRAARSHTRVTAVLADTSPSLVVSALLTCASLDSHGLVIDLEQHPGRNHFGVEDDRPTLWAAFGMVPNIDYSSFITWLHDALGPLDFALISANLSPEPWPEGASLIIPQYNNSEAQHWYLGALRELGINLITLEIRDQPHQADGAIWKIEVLGHLPARTDIYVYDQPLVLAHHQPLRVFYSYRFTPASFEKVLSDHKFSIHKRWIFGDRHEGIWLISAQVPGPPHQ